MDEKTVIWLTAIAAVAYPIIGMIFNTLITNKFNDQKEENSKLRKDIDQNRELLFKRMDEKSKLFFEEFVKREIYENDQKHLKERTDDRINTIMEFVKSQVEFIKTQSIATQRDIAEIKDTLKLNGSQNHGHK